MQEVHIAQPELRLLHKQEHAGGTYTAPAGVVIDAVTGDIDLVASTPGTYTITYTASPVADAATRQQLRLLSMHYQLLLSLIQELHIAQPELRLLHKQELQVEHILHLQEL